MTLLTPEPRLQRESGNNDSPRLKATNSKSADQFADDDDKRPDSQSLTKLLGSHSSIYNALTHPDLDIKLPMATNLASPSPLFNDRFATPPPCDPSTSFASWQLIHLNSESLQDVAKQLRLRSSNASPRAASNSILSNTSDEDGAVADSMVVLQRIKSTQVMVFDTDEEDDDGIEPGLDLYLKDFGDDDKTFISNHSASKTISMQKNSSFIMPKMDVSETSKVRLVVLSPERQTVKDDTREFCRKTQGKFLSSLLVQHLSLVAAPLLEEVRAAREADLLFIINDGSFVFVEFLRALVASGDGPLPPLTLVNLTTANCFVNLFEIINLIRPVQIWKTLSLQNPSLLQKSYVYLQDSISGPSSGRYHEEFKAKEAKSLKNRKSGALKLQKRGRNLEYKDLERLIRAELVTSLGYDIDPLRLSLNFGHLGLILDGFKKIFGLSLATSESAISLSGIISSGKFWLICGFSIGFGLGISLASDVKPRTFLFRLIASSRSATNLDKQVTEKTPDITSPDALAHLRSCANQFFLQMLHSLELLGTSMLSLFDLSLICETVEFLSGALSELRALSSVAVNVAVAGLEKVAYATFGVTA